MKYLLFLPLIFLISCNKDEPNPTPIETTVSNIDTTNKVLVLKLNYLSYQFVGGYELEFTDTNTFTLNTHYYSPGDFGSVDIYYDEFNELIFDGTIIWSGLGEQTYPQNITPASGFGTLPFNYPMPDTNLFTQLLDNLYSTETDFHSQIWQSINNLSIVTNYRVNNPNSEINLLKYTPSIGVGNPADWFWIVILKS